jgi:hypothetical protein
LIGKRHHRRLYLRLLMAGLLLFPLMGQTAEFEVSNMKCLLEEGLYLLDADVRYDFSEKALEALANGVPLTLKLHLQIRRKGAWLWEGDVVDRRMSMQLRYHSLAALYQLVNLETGHQQSFATRDAALAALGEIRSLPLIKQGKLEQGESYKVQLRTSLDIDALPLPLRSMAYISPSWNLSSDWGSCEIHP